MQDPIVIYHSRLRLILITLGAAMFVVVGWFMAQSADPFTVLIGIASISFFGLCLVYALWRLVRPRPALTIDASGLTDTASGIAAGHIPWSDITDIRIFKLRNQKMLGVFVRNVDELIQRYSPIKQWLMRMNVRLVGTPIVIPRAALGTNLESLVALIQARRPVS